MAAADTRKFVILDRDGVINKNNPNHVLTPDDMKPFPRSLRAIAKLNQNGYTVLVFTNQPAIAKGLLTWKTLGDIHQKLSEELAEVGGKIEKYYVCPHSDDDKCFCRKPKPGMLYNIEDDFMMNLRKALIVGDKKVDIQAARAVKAKGVYVKTGWVDEIDDALGPVYENLQDVVEDLLSGKLNV